MTDYSSEQRGDIIAAKVRLYKMLLACSNDNLTENEIDLRYSLAKDRDVQKLLNNAKNSKKVLS